MSRREQGPSLYWDAGGHSHGRQFHPWTPRPASFLGPLFLDKLPSVSLSEQGGNQKEMLNQICIWQNLLEVIQLEASGQQGPLPT